VKEIYIFIIGFTLLIGCGEHKSHENSVVIKNETYYVKALEKDSLNSDLWKSLGEYYVESNDKSNAVRCFEKSLSFNSLNFDISFKLSEMYFKKLDLNNSHIHLEHCVKLDSLKTQPYLNLAQLAIFKSDYKSAFKYINSGLRINRYLPQGYFMKGVCYKHMKDTLKALSSFKTAVEVDPSYFQSYIEIGLILTSQKDSNGIQYYKNALEISPINSDAWFGLAWSYQSFGKVELATLEYQALLEKFPNYIDVKFNLGLLYLEQSNVLKAKKLFYEIIQEQSSNVDAYYNLYLCFKLERDSIKVTEFKGIILDIDSTFFDK
jgi:tetratricopeptide (TPR) repeat protein